MSEDEGSIIHVCQGPPRCLLEGDAAVEAQKAGCKFCTLIHVDADGTERVERPSEA